MKEPLQGKVILVTGSTGGLGKLVAEHPAAGKAPEDQGR